jgi:hypothetical protein
LTFIFFRGVHQQVRDLVFRVLFGDSPLTQGEIHHLGNLEENIGELGLLSPETNPILMLEKHICATFSSKF